MLLPNCLLLSTLIYKKQHVFATDSNVSPVIKPKLIFFCLTKHGGGGAVRHLTMPSLSDLSLNLALRAYLRADFKAKMAKIGNSNNFCPARDTSVYLCLVVPFIICLKKMQKSFVLYFL